MEFDKSKVFTAVNADELRPGSKVICSDIYGELKELVEQDLQVKTLKEIGHGYCQYRFITGDDLQYNLAYLVSEPEEKKLKWTDLKIGDVIETKDKHDRHCKAIVTRIDYNSASGCHVFAGNWISDETITEFWEKVENGND